MSETVSPIPPPLRTNIEAAFDVEDFSSWKDRLLVYLDRLEPYLIEILENGPFVAMSVLSTSTNPLTKPQTQWSPEDRRLANQNKRLKHIIISCLPNNVRKSVIKYTTVKDSDLDVEEDTRSRSKFLADLNVEFHDRALLDKGVTKVKAFMAIAEDEPFIRKGDTKSAFGWHLEEIQVTWAHLEEKQTRLRLYTNSFKEIVHTEHGDGVANYKRRRHDLESNDTSVVSKEIKKVSNKRSAIKAPKKKAQTVSPSALDPILVKKADSSTEQLLLTLMEKVKGLKEQKIPSDTSLSVSQSGNVVKKTLAKLKALSSQGSSSRKAPINPKPFIECKYCGFNYHHSDVFEYYLRCDICGSIAHETTHCTKKIASNKRKPRIASQSIIIKRHGKKAYDVFKGRSLDIIYFYVFGCLVYIHNHIDHLGKFDAKADDGFFLGYSLMAKAFRDINSLDEHPEFTIADDHHIPNEHADSESVKDLRLAEDQVSIIYEPISEPKPSPTNILPSAEAGVTTKSKIKDSKATSTHECLYVNFFSKIEPKEPLKLWKKKDGLLQCKKS
ncbi:hypothetical protein Tco_0317241 [Tanacetum coccineum]